MIAFNPKTMPGSTFWATELSSCPDWPQSAADAYCLLGSPYSCTEVCRGDLIYGFLNGRLAQVWEVLDMVTPPTAQAQLNLGSAKRRMAPCWITTVRIRNLPLDLEALIWQDRLTYGGESLTSRLERELAALRPTGVPVSGVAWRFHPELGQELVMFLRGYGESECPTCAQLEVSCAD